MVLFRRLLGDVLRRHRQRQGRTLRDVAAAARISLGYLSEVERGRKEASSELLASLCKALDVSLADVLREVSQDIAVLERAPLAPAGFAPTSQVGAPAMLARPVLARAGTMPSKPGPSRPAQHVAVAPVAVDSVMQSPAIVSSTRMHVAAA